MDSARIRITAKQLVHRYAGAPRVNQRNVLLAIHHACRRGYLPNYLPPPSHSQQHLVLLHANTPMAAVYRYLAADGRPTPVPRGLIESRVPLAINSILTGSILAHIGIAIVRIEDRSIVLKGTSTELAHEINLSRYGTPLPQPAWVLIERATGQVVPPHQIDDDLRLRAALVYDEFDIDVTGLLEGQENVSVVSRWRFGPPPLATSDMVPPF